MGGNNDQIVAALAVATSAEAMSPAPLHEPDDMITQIRKARQARCWDPNQRVIRVINGVCEFDARAAPPAEHKCVAWNDGFCIEHDGTLKGWRARR